MWLSFPEPEEVIISFDIHEVVNKLRAACEGLGLPIVTEISRKRRAPYEVLVSTILSLRTKDGTTRAASNRLFSRIQDPKGLLELSEEEIQALIYPVGFYKNKARTLKEISSEILTKYDGKVPDDVDELLKFKGVGRKTANLVVTLGHGKLGLCVDIHVHRISNRMGYVETKTPDQTEMALRAKLPQQYWIEYNDLLVTYGQNICKPVSPFCSKCAIETYCPKIGVSKRR